MASRWIEETFHPHWRVGFEASQVLHEVKNEHQELVIFENETWGRVLLLDGVFQLTTRDDFIYHEMMAHVPLMASKAAKRVLIVGGGDGGVLREVLRHASVEKAVVCEIDKEVVDTSLKYFPEVAAGGFEDGRTELVIADGLKYVAETDDKFDVIIVDSSEPIGPSAVLHTRQFFADCKRALKKKGILVTQNGLGFLFPEHLAGTTRVFGSLFKRVAPYMCTQPCYFGGPFFLNLATDAKSVLTVDVKALKARAKERNVSGLRYWTPAVHLGAFALPVYAAEVVAQAKSDAAAGDDSGYAPDEVARAVMASDKVGEQPAIKAQAAKPKSTTKPTAKAAAAGKRAGKAPVKKTGKTAVRAKKPAGNSRSSTATKRSAAAKKTSVRKSAAQKTTAGRSAAGVDGKS